MLLEVAFLRGSCIPDAWTPWDAGEVAGLSALKGEEVTMKTGVRVRQVVSPAAVCGAVEAARSSFSRGNEVCPLDLPA